MAHIGADLSNVQAQSFDPIPPGEYTAQVTDSAVVMTKTTNLPMLKVTFTVVEGPFLGRKIFENFLLSNEIAKARLKSLATCGGHRSPDIINDSEELHGLGMKIIVKLKNDPNYPPSNSITGFKKIENSTPPISAPSPFAVSPVVPPQFAPPMQFNKPETLPPPPVTPPFQFAAQATTPPVAASVEQAAKPVVANPLPAAAAPAAKLPWE